MGWSERVTELALSVIRDPLATPEEKDKARAVAMGEGLRDHLDTRRLPLDERQVFHDLIRRAIGQVVPEDRLASLIKRRADELAAGRLAALTIADHLRAIIALDPDGTELRRGLATVLEDQGDGCDGEADNRKGTGGVPAIADLSDPAGATHVSTGRGSPSMTVL